MWLRRFCGVDSRGLERGAPDVDTLPLVKVGDDESGVLRGWLFSRCEKSKLGSCAGVEVCICALEDAERVLGFGRVDDSGAVFR
jgi:hypothetical protein